MNCGPNMICWSDTCFKINVENSNKLKNTKINGKFYSKMYDFFPLDLVKPVYPTNVMIS